MLLLSISALLGSLLGFVVWADNSPLSSSGQALVQFSRQTSVDSLFNAPPKATPVPALPTSLRIPKLNVATNIEHVGEDEQGNMGVPQEVHNVAWYQYGYIPGTPGSAVIAGHLDSTTGPAIFYHLESLQAGDDIFVTASDGKQLHFKVLRTATYSADDFPIQEVFGAALESRLNLITCEGVFDDTTKSYSQRTVVYSILVQ